MDNARAKEMDKERLRQNEKRKRTERQR